MFFVFGPTGRVLRGDADAIARVGGPRRVGRPQALRTRSQDGQAFEAPDALAQRGQPRDPLPARSAPIAAYEQTARGPVLPRQPLKLVSEVMTQGAITVAPQTRVNDAWQTMAQHRVAQAPVVDDKNQVIGLLMRADMAPLDLLPEPGAIQQAIALARRPVSEVMVSPVATVSADTDLRRVAQVFLDTGLPALPVTDEDGRCSGFISRTDILRAMVAEPPLDLWS